MSGYAVVIRRPTVNVAPEELHALLPAMRQRGPHGDSVVTQGAFGAASTLLDVGDPRLVPAWTSTGTLIVAGHVRVDARATLVQALRQAGADASEDDSDIQLFALAWSRWSDHALERMLGDFSAAIYDRESHVTTLVRDPFGVRMLFYHAAPDRLVASNTLAAVLGAGVSRELDEDAIADFIAEGLNEDPSTTTFRAVRRVPAAHWLRIHPDGRQELRRYWELPIVAIDRSRPHDTIVAEFRALLDASVRDRIRAPRVTVFMSGGLDSPTLAAIAARALGDPALVIACTAHLPILVPTEDTERARMAAATIGVSHVVTDVEQYGYREGTAYSLPSTPEPCDELDLLAVFAQLRLASSYAPVAFWGEDPDAVLAPPHLGELLRGSALPRLVLDIFSYWWRQRARPHLQIRDLLRALLRRLSTPDERSAGPAWLRADLRERRAERVRARREPVHPTRGEVARRLDQIYWQPFLELLDAGFHGIPIDVRLPYLDLRVIGFALAAPPIPWMQRKFLLREAARGLIPESVRLAPKRGLPGLYDARLAQWWSRNPAPFVPSDALAQFVDVRGIPKLRRSSSTAEALMHLRLRVLDRWLGARGEP